MRGWVGPWLHRFIQADVTWIGECSIHTSGDYFRCSIWPGGNILQAPTSVLHVIGQIVFVGSGLYKNRCILILSASIWLICRLRKGRVPVCQLGLGAAINAQSS